MCVCRRSPPRAQAFQAAWGVAADRQPAWLAARGERARGLRPSCVRWVRLAVGWPWAWLWMDGHGALGLGTARPAPIRSFLPSFLPRFGQRAELLTADPDVRAVPSPRLCVTV